MLLYIVSLIECFDSISNSISIFFICFLFFLFLYGLILQYYFIYVCMKWIFFLEISLKDGI